MSDFTFPNMKEFQSTLETYVGVATKAAAPAINHVALNLARRWAQNIPKATNAGINASLKKEPHLLAALTSISLHGTKLKKPAFKEAMDNFVKARQGTKAYLRAGMAPAVEQLGGVFRSGTTGKAGYASRKALDGYAKLATGSDPVALVVWITDQPNSHKQEGAEKICYEALGKATLFVIEDMNVYITRKLSEVFE